MSLKLKEVPYKERIEEGIQNDFARQAVASRTRSF